MEPRETPRDPSAPNRQLSRLWGPGAAYTNFYVAQFLFLGVFLPFFPGWLDEKGFSAAGIGALTGGALVLRLMFAPVLAYRFESFQDPRIGLRIAGGAIALFSVLLLVPMPNPMIAIVGILVWFTFGLLSPLTDTAVLRADRRGELRYGLARGIGSASFVAANLIGGAVIARYGDNATVLWVALAATSVLIIAFALPPEDVSGAGGRPRPSMQFALGLFRSKSFLLMLFAGGLAQGAHATYYAFSELHWSALGYSSFTIGCLWAVGVIFEIGFLFAARPLCGRFSPAVLIGAGALGAMIRWPIVGLSPPLPLLFLLQTLHALTFAATYLGTIEFIDRAVPAAYRTTAMTLVSSLGVGAMTGVATVGVGMFFDRNAAFPAYGLMGAMGGVGVALAFWLYRRWDGGPLKAVPAED